MKIVALSDTHMFHNDIKVPDGDILIHAGDATSVGTLREVSEFAHWFRNLPHDLKLFVPGNHDFLFEQSQDLASSIIEQFDNCFVLIDDELEWDGIKFYGSPWVPKFGEWAFMEDRDCEDLMHYWKAIPDDVDVLITHGPPKGILDVVTRQQVAGYGNTIRQIKENVGCDFLRDRLLDIMPKIHIFGHVHDAYGNTKLTRDNKTTHFYNCCICTEEYHPIRQVTEIEVR